MLVRTSQHTPLEGKTSTQPCSDIGPLQTKLKVTAWRHPFQRDLEAGLHISLRGYVLQFAERMFSPLLSLHYTPKSPIHFIFHALLLTPNNACIQTLVSLRSALLRIHGRSRPPALCFSLATAAKLASPVRGTIEGPSHTVDRQPYIAPTTHRHIYFLLDHHSRYHSLT